MFGAGASAPFGIPTMQGMVKDFETVLHETGSKGEAELYSKISRFLKVWLGRLVDLEAVFSVVDSIVNWSPDRFGIAALYQSFYFLQGKIGKELDPTAIKEFEPPTNEEIQTAYALRNRFQDFVRTKCEIPESGMNLIEPAYGTLFDMVGSQVLGGPSTTTHRIPSDSAIFTTNYDASLEHYWIDCVKTPLNTGFTWNEVAGMKVSNPGALRQFNYPKLFKLHGSVTWFNDPEYGLTEQRVVPRDMKKWTGSKFLGQAMLYPIEEKELYVEPYLTMFEQLNSELSSAPLWIIVGYSFGDRFIRDVFIRNSKGDKRIVLLHPHGSEVIRRLDGIRGKTFVESARFGVGDIAGTCQSLINRLRS